MGTEKKGLGIIFHSGSFDRLNHGLSIASAALAIGRDVRLFFTYWSLDYLKRREPALAHFNNEAKRHQRSLKKNLERGHLHKFSELITQTKKMGARFYVCTGSMGLLNISRTELIPEIDKSMGITTFLIEINSDQIIFI